MAGGPRKLPKWQTSHNLLYNKQLGRIKKIFTKVVDSADTKSILIASHDKKPNDHDPKKSSDWHLTSDILDGKICLLGLNNTTNLEVCYEEVFFYR